MEQMLCFTTWTLVCCTFTVVCLHVLCRWAEGYGATVMSNEELPGVWTLKRMDGLPIDLSKVRDRRVHPHLHVNRLQMPATRVIVPQGAVWQHSLLMLPAGVNVHSWLVPSGRCMANVVLVVVLRRAPQLTVADLLLAACCLTCDAIGIRDCRCV